MCANRPTAALGYIDRLEKADKNPSLRSLAPLKLPSIVVNKAVGLVNGICRTSLDLLAFLRSVQVTLNAVQAWRVCDRDRYRDAEL